MPWLLACLLACLALLVLPGCGSRAERSEFRDDTARFRQARVVEYEQLKRDLRRYAVDQHLRSKELPVDYAAFIEWRHREWWNLTDETAALFAYERESIEKLVDGAARAYGYEARNFPRIGDDLARFFEHADPEWAGLVRDACIFIEWKDRELLPLRRDLQDAYERLGWEAGNLQLDVAQFVNWREREWRKLAHGSSEFMAWERDQGMRLRADLRRFRAARALEANYLVADFRAYWNFEVQAMPPRLIADYSRWSQLPPQELARLRDDIARFGETVPEDALKLVDDLTRFFDSQVDILPLLIAETDRFLDVYEREWGPLSAGARRYWRSNVGLGIVLRADMQMFLLEHGQTETAELQASTRRFIDYAGKEWKDFRRTLGRFLWDDSGRAFGDRGVPMQGDAGRPVFDDPRLYPVRGYDAGDQ
jgi:hypothetical protein